MWQDQLVDHQAAACITTHHSVTQHKASYVPGSVFYRPHWRCWCRLYWCLCGRVSSSSWECSFLCCFTPTLVFCCLAMSSMDMILAGKWTQVLDFTQKLFGNHEDTKGGCSCPFPYLPYILVRLWSTVTCRLVVFFNPLTKLYKCIC